MGSSPIPATINNLKFKIMHSEKEIREDMDKLRAHIEALRDKYGEDFSCVLSTGVGMEEYWAGASITCGKPYLLHQACHGLLENPVLVSEFFKAVDCVLSKDDKPEVLKKLMSESLRSLRNLVIKNSKGYKEYKEEQEAEQAVDDLLKQTGFTN